MTTSQEMDSQFGDGEIERRLKDLEDKVRAYEEGGMDIFRQFGYVQLGDQLPRLDPDGITFAAPEAGTGPTTAPDGARLIWRREAFTGDVVADIAGAHSTPGGTVDQNALYLRAFKSTDWADVKVGAWDDDVEDWLTVFGVRSATSSTFRLYAEDENDNFFFGVSRTDADNYVLSVRRGAALQSAMLQGSGSELTIAAGAITATTSYHRVDTEADAATDDLATINGGTMGQYLTLRAENGARDVVVKDGTGNLQLEGDMTLNNTQDTITLIYDSTLTAWLEVARSNNGA